MNYYSQRFINLLYSFVPSIYAHRVKANIKNEVNNNIKSITFLCKGNICRSVFAEYHLRKTLSSPIIKINSAGLNTTDGYSADKNAIKVAKTFTIDISSHRTRSAYKELLENSDLIFVMEPWQLIEAYKTSKNIKHKTFLLSCLIRNNLNSWSIEDPFDKDDTHFKECFNNISKANEVLYNIIKNKT